MELYKFESIYYRNNKLYGGRTYKKMLSKYEDIFVGYTNNHNFTFKCTDGDVRIRKEMLYYHVPDMNTLLSAQMKEASENTESDDDAFSDDDMKEAPENTEFDVAFPTDDIKYMIWFSISGLFWMDGELELNDYEYISWDRWVHRFEVLDYFFQGDDDIKQSIGKIIEMSISEDDVDMNFITTLIKWEFDVTPYSDKIARLYIDSRPFDLEFTGSILSIKIDLKSKLTVTKKQSLMKMLQIISQEEIEPHEDATNN